MAAQTKAQIRDRAGYELGLRPIGQGMEEQHKDLLEQFYDEIYAELKVEGSVPWASTASVPEEYVAPMVYLVALRGIGPFGTSNERANRIVGFAGPDGERARQNIRAQVRPHFEGSRDATDY